MIIIFCINQLGEPEANRYFDDEFIPAMKCIETLRACGCTHVVMSNEPKNMVGKMGVSAVENGKTPDGEVYDWSKADRAGRMRKSDLNKPVINDGEAV